MRVGVALVDDTERQIAAAALRDADMAPHTLTERAVLAGEIRDLYLDCVVVDAALIERGALGGLRRHDTRLPVVAVAEPSAAVSATLRRRNVVVVDRPLDPGSLSLAVALAHGEGRQARKRTRKPTGRFPARVGEAVADLLDVSDEGLRLEIDRAAAARLGPQFRLQVPMVALDVTVRRVWVGRGRGDRVQCGAVLLAPTPSQQRAWARVLDLAGSTAAVVSDGHRAPALAPRAAAGRMSALLAASPLVGALTTRFLR